ncbi:unnamed protein product [Moneuplotes crassus]|uniref:PX domain-containing protein n=1 Tax=Euplotes crassus TaxID=5936 RepID=A0AAD2D1Y0_EUPCR|nr:unnamed protein product [Moneuplotes crassus]
MEPIQIPSFRVQIMKHSKDQGFVLYHMKVFSVDDNTFHIEDRYRNMRALWESICEDAENAKRIPNFPPKKWFGSKSRDFLETRKTALQNFFNTLLDSPDKTIFKHIMKYFKKLAKNREASDALLNIEESVTKKREASPVTNKEEEVKSASSSPRKQSPQKNEEQKQSKANSKREAYKVNKVALTSKDYNETCSKIVDTFNKKLIDFGYAGAEAIQDIMAKGQNYVKHFEESNLNSEFNYQTKFLDIPEGNDKNLDLLENPDEDAENQNDVANAALQKRLTQLTVQLGKDQYEQFVSMNEVVWRGN